MWLDSYIRIVGMVAAKKLDKIGSNQSKSSKRVKEMRSGNMGRGVNVSLMHYA